MSHLDNKGPYAHIKKRILSLYTVLPVTLDEWQAAAKQTVQRYRLMDIKIGPYKPRDFLSAYKPIFQRELSKFGWN